MIMRVIFIISIFVTENNFKKSQNLYLEMLGYNFLFAEDRIVVFCNFKSLLISQLVL